MAILKDEEEQQGQGISQSLGQGMAGQPSQQQTVQQQSSQEPPTLSSSAPSMLGETARTPQAQKPQQKQQKAGTGTFTNIRSYLQAAQGGGQQRVAQAAQQQVQRLGTGAQKGLTQAQEAFRGRMGAGSGAVFQGEQNQYLDAAEAARRAEKSTEEILGAARGVTYQAPQPTQAPQTPTQQSATSVEPTTPPPAQTQQYFTPEQQQRFADIINAQYQGPASLQQAGLYEQAAEKARAAEQTGRLTETASGRQQLLRDIFGRTRQYGRGASKLDALLLNTSQEAVRQLQEQAQPALQAQQALQQAENLSANEALERRQALEQIRSGARTAFTEARTAEEGLAKDYIQNIQENWNRLPEYFRSVLQQSQTTPGTSRVGSVGVNVPYDIGYVNRFYDTFLGNRQPGTRYDLSREELDILGLTPGQAMFGVTPEAIQAAQMAKGEELITKDQLSRQLALQQLANLDVSNELRKNLLYTDLEKAGTKNILSSLDTQKLRNIMEENRRSLEQDLARQGGTAIYTTPSQSYKRYNFLDLLKSGGYTPLDFEGLRAEDASAKLLEDIAAGAEYTPQTTAEKPGYIQSAFEKLFPSVNERQLAEWGLAPVQSTLAKYGGTSTAQQVENEQTKARAQALRDMLSEIYKK